MKFNKILLLIILLCICITLIGCGTLKGFDSDLWKDSKKVVKIIKNTYSKDNNFSVRDEEFIEKYFETYKGRTYDNPKEDELIQDVEDLYIKCRIYILSLSDNMYIDDIGWDRQGVEKAFQNLKDNYQNLVK